LSVEDRVIALVACACGRDACDQQDQRECCGGSKSGVKPLEACPRGRRHCTGVGELTTDAVEAGAVVRAYGSRRIVPQDGSFEDVGEESGGRPPGAPWTGAVVRAHGLDSTSPADCAREDV